MFASSGANIFQKMENCNFPRVFFHLFIIVLSCFSCFIIFASSGANFSKKRKIAIFLGFFFIFYYQFIMFLSFVFHFSSFVSTGAKKKSKKWKLAIFLDVFSFFLISCLSFFFSSFLLQLCQKKNKKWKNAMFLGFFSFFLIIPECVARVPVSLWGSGGWGCVRSTLPNRPQPFATVRNRPYEVRMAVPMGSFAEVVIFGCFRRVVASFCVAGVALCGIQTCFATCWKSFCVAGTILLRRFQKMCCSFRGRRSTLDVSIVIFRGRRSTLDVSCCVFFVNRIGRAASSGDNVQIPWQAWHFVRCAGNWRKPRTKHRVWGCKFSGSKENS